MVEDLGGFVISKYWVLQSTVKGLQDLRGNVR